ncbi:MAG: hypothetical protein ACREH8_21890 [Opitutaceae bacterium]
MSGVNPSAFRVAVYNFVPGLGWWTKPTFDSPSVPISADSSFRVDALDIRATIFCVALIPATYNPPLTGGGARVPADLSASAFDFMERHGRQIQFAGRAWAVKDSPVAVGPNRLNNGPGNLFSADASDVWADEACLHLTLKQKNSSWWGTEVRPRQRRRPEGRAR